MKLTSKLIKLSVTAILCMSFVFLNPKEIFNPVRSVFFAVSYPFQKTFYLLSDKTENALSFLSSISDLHRENENLLRENNKLAAEIASLRDVKKENDNLRRQLELAPKDKFDLEPCFVIGQSPQGQGSWIMIGKGSSDGLENRMPVIVSDGILIGKVAEVYLNSAKVSLLTDPLSLVNAEDLETGSKGVIKGEYSLGLVLDMVPQTEVLNEGDTIVTSGLGANMPKGLHIGKVQEVQSSGDKLFQQGLVIPRVKYTDLETVFVIKNVKQEQQGPDV